MRKHNVIVDGRIFSLQHKGGISQLWAYTLTNNAWKSNVATTLLLYPGYEKNIHLVEADLVNGACDINIIFCPIPPSDNMRFDSQEACVQRADCLFCNGVVVGDVDAVLNTYYGECVLPGVRRYIVTALDFAHEDLPLLAAKPTTTQVLKMKRLSFAQATEVAFISNASRTRFFQHYPEFPRASTRVIHLGHDRTDPLVQKVYGLIVHVGTRGAYKNFDRAVPALEQVLATEWASRLLIVGGEPVDDSVKRLRKLFPDRVSYISQPTDEAIDLAVGLSHVYLSVSQYEGFGIPLLNALRLGSIPVISNIAVYQEIAGEHAEYFDPEESKDIEFAILRALKRSVPSCLKYNRTWNDVATDYVRLLDGGGVC